MPSGELCRLCGERKKMLTNLFHGNLLQKIRETVQLKITMDDALPKSTCYECQRQIELYHAFKTRCQRAEGKLYEIIACGQLHTRSGHTIKEEHAELEHDSRHDPTTEHSYCSVATAITKVKIKTEVQEVVVAVDPVVQVESQEDNDVIIEELVHQHALTDVKKPIVREVDLQQQLPFLEDEVLEIVPSKKENSFLVEVNLDEKPALNPSSNYGGFNDEDLVLKENEPEMDDADYERIEAEIMKKRDPNMRFKCPHCRIRRSFNSYKVYLKHKQSFHGDGNASEFLCAHCCAEGKPAGFASLSLLKAHLFRMHIREPRYTCSYCQGKFRSRLEYRKHLKDHQKKKLTCGECRKEFSLKSKLRVHMGKHLDERNYICGICGKTYKWLSNLQYHEKIHKGPITLNCDQCGSQYTSENGLKAHLKTHNAISYPCSSCDQSFTQASSLKRHRITFHEPISETISKYLSCGVCGKSFTNHSNLANHKKIHEKKHLCTYCGVKWARIQQLKEHVMAVHMKMKHACPIGGCGKSYTQRTPLATHFRRCHPGYTLASRKPQPTSTQPDAINNEPFVYEYSSQASEVT